MLLDGKTGILFEVIKVAYVSLGSEVYDIEFTDLFRIIFQQEYKVISLKLVKLKVYNCLMEMIVQFYFEGRAYLYFKSLAQKEYKKDGFEVPVFIGFHPTLKRLRSQQFLQDDSHLDQIPMDDHHLVAVFLIRAVTLQCLFQTMQVQFILFVEIMNDSKAECNLLRIHFEDLFIETDCDDVLFYLSNQAKLLIKQTLEIGRVDLRYKLDLSSAINIVVCVTIHKEEDVSFAEIIEKLSLKERWKFIRLLKIMEMRETIGICGVSIKLVLQPVYFFGQGVSRRFEGVALGKDGSSDQIGQHR